jgi:hypothetical protein
MNGIDSVALATLITRSERDLHQYKQNPLANGALVAAQPNRSVLTSLVVAAKDKLARR